MGSLLRSQNGPRQPRSKLHTQMCSLCDKSAGVPGPWLAVAVVEEQIHGLDAANRTDGASDC
jgi:hypothetical protein